MTVHRRDEAPFVGRDELLAEFRSAIDEAHDGRGACFLLTGEPGIGKTSCLEQLRRMARAKGLQVLSGRCTQEEEGAPAYWPWIQALRDLGTGQSLSAGLERAGSGGDGVRARRFRLFDALARELRDAAAQQAILILLDDLHRADVPSLLLLRHLIRECAESGIVVVAAQRTSASVGPSQADRTLRDVRQAYRSVALTGISIEAIVRLIELSLEGPAPPGLARALHGRTGGNPLFVSQLLQLLASRSGSREGFDDTTALLPSGIQDAIRDRIASLPDEAHMLLEAAAAIGTEFRLELLARLWTSAREALEGLDAPLASRILSRDSDDPGAFRFVHALLRDAVYESTPLRTRLELHEAILRGLESIHRDDLDSVLARLAHHATEAAPRIGWEPAFRYCERAADHAASHLAHEEAIRHYQSALHALRLASDDEPSVRCLSTRVHLKLGRARWQAGEHTAAREEFLHAARGARDIEDADTFAQAAFGFAGKSDATMGVNRDAVALLEEALQRLGPEDAALTSQIMARLATELYFAEESERRERLARNAVAMAERVGDDATLAYDLTALCHVLHPHGGAEILPLADRLITTARRARIKDVEALGHHHRLLVHQRANDLGTAAEAVSQYARLAREMRDPWFEWAATAYRAGIALAAGRLDETERLIEHGFEIGNAVDTPNTLSFFGGTLFFLRRDQGRLAEMEDAIRAMVARTPEFPVFRLALAQVLAEADNLEEARPIYESIVRRWKTVPHDAMWSACAEIASHLVILFDDPRGAGRLRDTLAEQPDDGLIVGFGNAWLGSASPRAHLPLPRRNRRSGPAPRAGGTDPPPRWGTPSRSEVTSRAGRSRRTTIARGRPGTKRSARSSTPGRKGRLRPPRRALAGHRPRPRSRGRLPSCRRLLGARLRRTHHAAPTCKGTGLPRPAARDAAPRGPREPPRGHRRRGSPARARPAHSRSPRPRGVPRANRILA